MLSFLYKSIIQLRNFLYDIKILKIYKSNIPVISIGNLTVGGTGKTPFVIFLIRYFLKKNLTPLIISRGYGRSSKGQIIINSKTKQPVTTVGDEPYLISKKFPHVDIIINQKRTEAIKWAEKSSKKYDIIILDDAYQHRSVFRNLNILLINTRQNHHFLLPKGDLREPINNINRADCIVLTKGGSLGPSINFISKLEIPIYSTKESFSKATPIYNKGIAFCGIGDSSSFKKTLASLSLDILNLLEFKDHEKYSPSTIKKIELSIKETKQNVFFTTEKDWVKLPDDFIKKYHGCSIIMETTIEDDSFYNMINNSIK